MKSKVVALALCAVLVILFGGCMQNIVCDNQDIATNVKNKATVILGMVSGTLTALNSELALAKDDAIIASLQTAAVAAQLAINAAFHLVYEVACPELEALNKLELQADTVQVSSRLALSKAKASRR